ncbi:hypothetical protein [Bartonella sp. AP7XZML]
MAYALEKSSIAIGSEYNKKSEYGENDYTLSKSDYSTVVGAVSKVLEYGSISLGYSVHIHLLKKLFLWASIQKQKGLEVSL